MLGRRLVRVISDGIHGHSERVCDIDELQAIPDSGRNDNLSDLVSGFKERSHGVFGSSTILHGRHRHQRSAHPDSRIKGLEVLSEYSFVNEKLGAQGTVRFDQPFDGLFHFVHRMRHAVIVRPVAAALRMARSPELRLARDLGNVQPP
jgi:hypothetical protein